MIRLQQLRLDALLTPEQLGERAGVSGNAVRRIEKNGRATLAVLEKLADYFSVPPSSLLLEARQPDPSPSEAAA